MGISMTVQLLGPIGLVWALEEGSDFKALDLVKGHRLDGGFLSIVLSLSA